VARPDKGMASVSDVRHAHPVGLGVPPRIPFATTAEIRSCTLASAFLSIVVDTSTRDTRF
jgi:hypothetical protein